MIKLEELPVRLEYENTILTLEICADSCFSLYFTYRNVYRYDDRIPSFIINPNCKESNVFATLLNNFKKSCEYSCIKDPDKEEKIKDLYWASSSTPRYNIEVSTLDEAVQMMDSWLQYAYTIGYSKN